MKNRELFINENEYPDIPKDKCIEHLSKAIQCPTVSYVDTDKIDYASFDNLHKLIVHSYPNIMAKGELKEINHSVLIKIAGSDSSLKPALLMAHQDVVPVVAGTEKDWIYPPFSGTVSQGIIYGRGAIDIKQMLIGELEAVEYLLSKGLNNKRTIYLAFGHDEETLNTGAQGLAQYLASQGITLEFVLDEGASKVMDGKCYGADGTLISSIGMFEKGYADLKLEVESTGGHSSNPYHGTSLSILAKAITEIMENPLPAQLSDCTLQTLEILKPYIQKEPFKSYLKDIDKNKDLIIDYYLNHEELYNQIITTIAPTMISAGAEAGNVMPQHMEAVINFRLAVQDTTDSLLKHCQKVVSDKVKASYVQCINASKPSDPNSYGYKQLVSSLQHYFKDIIFIPSVSTVSTDAHNYEDICNCCLRYDPFLEENSIKQMGMHGTNEQISIDAYMQGIRVLIHLIENTCY